MAEIKSRKSERARSTDTSAGPDEISPAAQAEPDADSRARAAELTEQLNDARWRYHVLDAPTISDGEFDAMMRELNELEDSDSRRCGRRTRRPSRSAGHRSRPPSPRWSTCSG